MAKTKPEIDRNEKREEILGVARRLFVETGYDASSMSRIAEEAGVAPNTIYWYFADKDALLIAVLNDLLADGMREYEERKKSSPETQLLWLLGKFDSVQGLIATVHARLSTSQALRTWHDNYHLMNEATLRAELARHGMPSADLGPAARVYMFVLEGLFAHPTPNKDRQAIVKWFISALGETIRASTRAGGR
jgi:TetR/AcrR family transcriptional regulator, cholesterol catabolism regulator